jgi:fatty acid desaturase
LGGPLGEIIMLDLRNGRDVRSAAQVVAIVCATVAALAALPKIFPTFGAALALIGAAVMVFGGIAVRLHLLGHDGASNRTLV